MRCDLLFQTIQTVIKTSPNLLKTNSPLLPVQVRTRHDMFLGKIDK